MSQNAKKRAFLVEALSLYYPISEKCPTEEVGCKRREWQDKEGWRTLKRKLARWDILH
jgi:hypothetical protein